METIYDTVIFVLVVIKTAQTTRITSLRQSITFLITAQSLVYFAYGLFYPTLFCTAQYLFLVASFLARTYCGP